jgi:hypothetical protein
MSTHTPGPWKAEVVSRSMDQGRRAQIQIHGSITPISAVVVADLPTTLAWPPPEPGHHATWDGLLANAHLIAAAPEMLSALRVLLTRYDELTTGRTKAHIQFQREIEPVRALIAKIEGAIQ